MYSHNIKLQRLKQQGRQRYRNECFQNPVASCPSYPWSRASSIAQTNCQLNLRLRWTEFEKDAIVNDTANKGAMEESDFAEKERSASRDAFSDENVSSTGKSLCEQEHVQHVFVYGWQEAGPDCYMLVLGKIGQVRNNLSGQEGAAISRGTTLLNNKSHPQRYPLFEFYSDFRSDVTSKAVNEQLTTWIAYRVQGLV